MSRPPEYDAWAAMQQRCNNPKHPSFPNYGERAIFVCERWRIFRNFIADMGERPGPGFSIDRIDNDRGYSSDNCRWATRSDQARNTRVRRDNAWGTPGVSIHKKTGKWRVCIASQHIGLYGTLEAAVSARRKAEQTYWGRP